MSTQMKVAGAPSPTTTQLTGQSHRPSLLTLYATRPKSQVAQLLDIADFALSQERALRQRALLADDDREARELRARAAQWAAGREALLQASGGGR